MQEEEQLAGKAEEKRLLGRPVGRYEENITGGG
jgi:hypothetical protein